MRIDIGVRVGNLAVFLQNIRHDLVDRVDDLEEFVIGHVLQGEFSLARVARIRLSKDGVAVSGDDLFGVQSVPSEFGNGVGVDVLTLGLEFGLEVLDPSQNFLVGQSVERSGKGVESGGIRQVRVTEGRSDQMGGMGRRVTSLVIGVDAEVQPHKFVERRVVVSQHAAKVGRVIQGGILGDDAVKVDVAVNGGGNFRQLGDDVEDVFQDVFVVIRLGGTLLVGLGKGRIGLARVEADGELRHGMHVLGEGIQKGNDVGGEFGARMKFGGERIDLFLGGHFGGQKQPEERFQKGFTVSGDARVGGEDGLAFRNGEAAESDSLVGIQVGSFPQHALDSTGSTNTLIHGDLSNDVTTVFFLQSCQIFLLFGDLGHQRFLKGSDGAGALSDGNLADKVLDACG
mmetsp:Transcript_29188/g.44939  ORF Transcript_29188/g.44939 Transcript_29188/m.44939 type:complete len:399 (+) Transcript_29188:306-1502(+)